MILAPSKLLTSLTVESHVGLGTSGVEGQSEATKQAIFTLLEQTFGQGKGGFGKASVGTAHSLEEPL